MWGTDIEQNIMKKATIIQVVWLETLQSDNVLNDLHKAKYNKYSFRTSKISVNIIQ